MNAIAWMLSPPKPVQIGEPRVHRIAGPEDVLPYDDAPAKQWGGKRIDAATSAQRQLEALNVLKAAGRMLNAKEMSASTGIPGRSIRRYMERLIDEGQPIEAKNGYGYVWKGDAS